MENLQSPTPLPERLKSEQFLFRTAILGITGYNHRSRSLDLNVVMRAETIFCLTEQHRQNVVQLFPAAAAKTRCLAEGIDVEDTAGEGEAAYTNLAAKIQGLVQFQLEGLI